MSPLSRLCSCRKNFQHCEIWNHNSDYQILDNLLDLVDSVRKNLNFCVEILLLDSRATLSRKQFDSWSRFSCLPWTQLKLTSWPSRSTVAKACQLKCLMRHLYVKIYYIWYVTLFHYYSISNWLTRLNSGANDWEIIYLLLFLNLFLKWLLCAIGEVLSYLLMLAEFYITIKESCWNSKLLCFWVAYMCLEQVWLSWLYKISVLGTELAITTGL